MAEFWEEAFQDKQEMWGWEPAQSAIMAHEVFQSSGVQNVLVPGFGYGRNAKVFSADGMAVTGIEISQTAIELARKHFGEESTIHHGSVTEMPFDDHVYDGLFCYALIHLLDQAERRKLIADCYNQLTENDCMIFTAITKDAPTYGQGRYISKDRFEIFEGVKMFFYDRESITQEFGDAGLVSVSEVSENFPFYFITCRKDEASL